MSHQYWFRPRKYGYGATPVTWEGWALVFAFVVVVAALVPLVLHGGSIATRLLSATLIGAAIVVLTAVSMKKTDGAWHWSWGGRSNSGKND
jgi:hypothetical protein